MADCTCPYIQIYWEKLLATAACFISAALLMQLKLKDFDVQEQGTPADPCLIACHL